jgi:glycerol kinase
MSVFLAVDQSTSATKALLFSAQGELLDTCSRIHEQIYPRPGWVEHNPEQIYANTIQSLQTLLGKHPETISELACLSITNQRETFVLFDRQTGAALYNAIVWQCRRGEALCAALEHAGYGGQVSQLTGLKIDTYFPASKLRWLLDERPDLRRRMADGSALFGTMDAYLVYRLTGNQVYATDHTNASRTLFYDITSLDWNPDLLAIFDIPAGQLPEIRESSACFGYTDLDGFLPRPIPICGVMGDSQAALFAQRCFSPGSAKVTFGSGSSLLLNLGERKALPGQGSVTAVAWVLAGQPTYALEGITNFTGATIVWLRDQLELIDDPAEAEALATAVPDNGGVYLVPAFVGLSAPYWRSDVRAAISGLTPASNRKHVVRAALESIAYIVNDALKQMEQDARLKLQAIHADGGASRNQFLMQFVADITGHTVLASRLAELSAFGAVMMGMLAVQAAGGLDDLLLLPNTADEYRPQREPAEVAALLSGWERAVQQVLTTQE